MANRTKLPEPVFERSRLGYHHGQVDEWISVARAYIGHLEQRLRAAAAHDGQAMVSELLQIAADEISGRKADADAEIAQLRGQAKTELEQLRTGAQGEAAALLQAAQGQADQLLTDARVQAKQQIDTAAARASTVSDGAGRRLSALTGRHTETIRRLTEIRDVVASLVSAEQSRGSLEEEVARTATSNPYP